MATTEAETETLFLRLPPQLKAVLVETVGHMNAERVPGSPLHTINSVAIGILWTFFNQGSETVAAPKKRKARAK